MKQSIFEKIAPIMEEYTIARIKLEQLRDRQIYHFETAKFQAKEELEKIVSQKEKAIMQIIFDENKELVEKTIQSNPKNNLVN